MLGRACAVLAIAVLLAPATWVPVIDEAEATVIFERHLRTYPFEGIKITEGTLLLSTAEDHPEYYWVIEGARLLTLVDEDQTAVTGFVEVKRVGTDDIICRGAVAEYNDIHKHQICSDLRVGHSYVVTYVLSGPGNLELWGHTPQTTA